MKIRPDQMAMLRRMAALVDMTVSEFIRSLIDFMEVHENDPL